MSLETVHADVLRVIFQYIPLKVGGKLLTVSKFWKENLILLPEKTNLYDILLSERITKTPQVEALLRALAEKQLVREFIVGCRASTCQLPLERFPCLEYVDFTHCDSSPTDFTPCKTLLKYYGLLYPQPIFHADTQLQELALYGERNNRDAIDLTTKHKSVADGLRPTLKKLVLGVPLSPGSLAIIVERCGKTLRDFTCTSAAGVVESLGSFSHLEGVELQGVPTSQDISEFTSLKVKSLRLKGTERIGREVNQGKTTELLPSCDLADTVSSVGLVNFGLGSVSTLTGWIRNATKLDLQWNNLHSFDNVGLCKGIETLDISHNYFSDLNFVSATSCPNLHTLKCWINEITSLPATLPPNLTILNLSENRIESKDLSAISGLEKLIELNLSENPLITIPDDFFRLLQNLQKLDISATRITVIPPSIGQLSELTELNAAYNGLQDLPAELSLLRKLKTLSLQYNPLSELPITCTAANRAGWTVISKLRKFLQERQQQAESVAFGWDHAYWKPDSWQKEEPEIKVESIKAPVSGRYSSYGDWYANFEPPSFASPELDRTMERIFGVSLNKRDQGASLPLDSTMRSVCEEMIHRAVWATTFKWHRNKPDYRGFEGDFGWSKPPEKRHRLSVKAPQTPQISSISGLQLMSVDLVPQGTTKITEKPLNIVNIEDMASYRRFDDSEDDEEEEDTEAKAKQQLEKQAWQLKVVSFWEKQAEEQRQLRQNTKPYAPNLRLLRFKMRTEGVHSDGWNGRGVWKTLGGLLLLDITSGYAVDSLMLDIATRREPK